MDLTRGYKTAVFLTFYLQFRLINSD